MKGTLCIALLLLISACTSPGQPFTQDCQQTCEEQQTVMPAQSVANCPFNTCFGEKYVSHEYFTTKIIAHNLNDNHCNQAFIDLHPDVSRYVCFIKEANNIKEIGYEGGTDMKWEWQLVCGCSYEKV